jgi:hypothetical protein
MYSSAKAFATCEVLDMAGNSGAAAAADLCSAPSWSAAPALRTPRCALGLAGSLQSGCLFACGGYAGAGRSGQSHGRSRSADTKCSLN